MEGDRVPQIRGVVSKRMEAGCRKFETLSKMDGDRVPQVDLGLGHGNVAYNLCADGDVRFKQCPWPTIPLLSSSWPSAHLESRARWRLLAAVTQAHLGGNARHGKLCCSRRRKYVYASLSGRSEKNDQSWRRSSKAATAAWSNCAGPCSARWSRTQKRRRPTRTRSPSELSAPLVLPPSR